MRNNKKNSISFMDGIFGLGALDSNTYKLFIERTEEIKRYNSDISVLKNNANTTLTLINSLLDDQAKFELDILVNITEMQNPNKNLLSDFNLVLMQLNTIKYNYPTLNTNHLFNKYYDKIIEYNDKMEILKNERNLKVQQYISFIQTPKCLLMIAAASSINPIILDIINDIDNFAGYNI